MAGTNKSKATMLSRRTAIQLMDSLLPDCVLSEVA